jgi:ligand-binding sensor domain-containing protein
MHNDVNAIIEDKTGKLWFGTRGYTFIYDGKTFTTITNKDGKPFANVRSIIEDKKGNIWLGGHDGLWRYNSSTFTNFTQNFVGYIYEDKKGNIWTSSENTNPQGLALPRYGENFLSGSVSARGQWMLSRYDEKSLSNKKPTVTEIINKPMIFGILEDDKGSIWFGSVDGVYRYDGNTITSFNGKEGKK